MSQRLSRSGYSRAVLLQSAVIFTCLQSACGNEKAGDSYIRGHGEQIAKLSADAESRIVEAAIREAFDVEPSLSLRLHTRQLPRTAGDSGGNPTPNTLVRSLRNRGIVVGTCEPLRSTPKDTPRCSGPEAGYIIRPSDVFTVSRDTLEIHLAAEKYGAATGAKPEALRFEKVYQLVRRDDGWRVAREGRLKG